eukprot:SAG31_NODE_4313_length_3366_cov_3.879706_2_plen_108_part_00
MTAVRAVETESQPASTCGELIAAATGSELKAITGSMCCSEGTNGVLLTVTVFSVDFLSAASFVSFLNRDSHVYITHAGSAARHFPAFNFTGRYRGSVHGSPSLHINH